LIERDIYRERETEKRVNEREERGWGRESEEMG